jgi:hypothetical protein
MLPPVIFNFLDQFISTLTAPSYSDQSLEDLLWEYCYEWDLGWDQIIWDYVREKTPGTEIPCDPYHGSG